MKDKEVEEMQTVRQWSFSRLATFEECAFRTKLQYIDRIAEPDRGNPPAGMDEWPNDRGSRIHKAAEDYVIGERDDLVPECMAFKEEFLRLRDLHREGRVVCEEGWAVDHDWLPVAFNPEDPEQKELIWGRFIVDATVWASPERALVIDYKSGRKRGNEIKHGKQLQLYQLAAFLRYPDLEEIHAELWYLDQNDLTRTVFTRDQGMRFFKMWDDKAKGMTQTIEFHPNPGPACFFCPYKQGLIGKYGPLGTGDCEVSR